jgi:ribonuclease P protein subunit RPR2
MAQKSLNPGAKKLARERIDILFRAAEAVFPEKPEQAHRYVALARRIAMRQRIRIERDHRRRFCHQCYRFMVPGVNMRVRVHRGRVVVTCKYCGSRTRYPIRGKE